MPDRKFMNVMRLSLILTAGLAIMSAPAHAQEADNHSSLTIGVGPAYVPSYEGSDSHRVIPLVQARGKVKDFAFFTRGTTLYIDAIPNRADESVDIEAGFAANLRLDRTSGIKDQAVRALGKLDTAIEVGGFVGIGKTGVITSDYDNLSARVSWMKDVNGAHGSYVITPAIEYMAPLSVTTFVGFAATADYVGKGYGRYYYDIDAAGSAASGLPVYTGAGDDSGFKKVGLNLTAGKSLSGDLRKGWTIFALGGYSKLLGDYRKSPIVALAGDSNQWVGAIGIGYTF
jgi:outer membrane scaffolding protein for murein synthesis (MipA/OmpV family)